MSYELWHGIPKPIVVGYSEVTEEEEKRARAALRRLMRARGVIKDDVIKDDEDEV